MVLCMTARPAVPGNQYRTLQTPRPTHTCEALAISTACPSSPNPVTSVAALQPCCRSMPAAPALLAAIAARQLLIQRPLAWPRIAAARMLPVPRGLVSMRAWPGLRPALVRMFSGLTWPVMAKPACGERAAIHPSNTGQVCGHARAWPGVRPALVRMSSGLTWPVIAKPACKDGVGCIE
jgi:hypothetical protein